MLDFQRYQIAFTTHIRNPKAHAKPANVPDTRMAIYREIVFNSIFGSVSACFPVCQQVLGKRAWRKLTQDFFAQHQAATPIFREIPQEFLKFLRSVGDLPGYFQQLAHYEWVELSVNMQDVELPKISRITDLLNERPILAPASMLLEYDYPVHKISAKFKPKFKSSATEKTYLCVFRNFSNQVKFIELNPMTYMLLSLLKDNHYSGEQALTLIAEGMLHPDNHAVIAFGMEILRDLANQEAIIGSAAI